MDIVAKALTVKRESKHVEFKQNFDPNSPGEWCELIKDLVAIANSGGGIIVFGLDSLGVPTGTSIDAITSIDPADIANKVLRYTGLVDFEFEIRRLTKKGRNLIAFVVQPVSVPLVFKNPGTYAVGPKKQHTAFGVGTVYFRHGAKSEPGTSEDIRRVIERQLEHIRQSWLKGVKKIVQAPKGAQIVAIQPTNRDAQHFLATHVHAVNDPKAIPVRLTRDPSLASGTFIHEEMSDGIFDEVNNVIDANRILAKGQKDFFLGQSVYYRIYAERYHVRQSEDTLALLLRNGIMNFYAPALYWALQLPEKHIALTLSDLYLYPTNRYVHSLIRIAPLFGAEFCQWLFGQWTTKWKGHPQPPSFYFTFIDMIKKMKATAPVLLAARLPLTAHIAIEDNVQIPIRGIIDHPEQAVVLVSKACMKVFQGAKDYKAVARNIDYLAYGHETQRRAPAIVKAFMKIVGNRKPGDLVDDTKT